MRNRLYIETWGCQMNRHDAERVAGTLAHDGLHLVASLDEADVVLFLGCMVRRKAEEKVYGRIGAIVEEKRLRPLILGVGGCLGQVRGEELLQRFPAIDFVFGSRGFSQLTNAIRRSSDEQERGVVLAEPVGVEETPVLRASSVTALVTITEGCSNYCSYCVVPYARGPMRSRPVERILEEVEDAVDAGAREVLLLGQNVNSYGTDLTNGDFVDLLERVSEVGPKRIRFTSSHPRDVDVRLFEAMARLPNVMPHIHAACQSGSDRILAAMNRGTTRRQLLSMVEKAREWIAGINFTTDLIVGFPGETSSDFRDTLDLVERGRFGSIFVAKYSPRPGTRSVDWVDDVSDVEKDGRLHQVLDRQRQIAMEENERLVGTDVEILVEGRSGEGAVFGRAPDHRTVSAMADEEPGALLTVRVTSATAAALHGEPIAVGTGTSSARKERP